MSIIKKIFSAVTGYYIHKYSTLPIGINPFIDIKSKIKYGSLNTIFDVGANTGQTWTSFRRRGIKGKIHCFEPVSETFEKLKSNTKADTKCFVNNFAFGEFSGVKTIRLFDSDQSVLNSLNEISMNGAGSETEEITIETIDLYCFNYRVGEIDLLKIDTEGYELNVLKGAQQMLNKSKISFIYCKVGFTESNDRVTNITVLTNWLANNGFYLFTLYEMGYYYETANGHFGNALYVRKDLMNINK